MKSWARLMCAAAVTAAIPAAMLFVGARACGPDWEPEEFVPEHHPAAPKLYADGQLGLLRLGYYRAELVVAYRYLMGGSLSEAEKDVFVRQVESPYDSDRWDGEQAQAVTQWISARRRLAGDGPNPEIDQNRVIQRSSGNWSYQDTELNCTDGAFVNATATLESRATSWGANSAELKEWLAGQDAVFANCKQPAAMPSPVQPQWPALLRQDRAYQIAAANFYARRFDDAVGQFEAIGRDSASPWSRWGEYLAARAVVRKASDGLSADDPSKASFNTELLRDAQVRLVRLKQATHDPQIRHAAEDEFGYVQVRLDPAARLRDVSTALAGPKPDADFRNHLADFDYLMNNAQLNADTDLSRWVRAMQSGADKQVANADTTPKTAPWLIASLSRPTAPDPELLSAAASVPASSPAYVTVNFQRARLLLNAGKQGEARALITTVLGAVPAGDFGTRNALLEQRMPTAHTLEQFLSDAPRTVPEATSEAASLTTCAPGNNGNCTHELPKLQFDNDAAVAFNKQLPLALWVQAARSPALPQNLRQAVAWAGWIRSLGLEEGAVRRQLAPMLPVEVKSVAGESDGFAAMLAVLRNPGLQPYLIQGVQRSVSYATLDSFRDNWWCSRWGDGDRLNQDNAPDVTIAPGPGPLPFLTAAQRKQAEAERAKLNALPNATMWLGQRTLDYVKAHPQEKNAAEALALVVRATHYSCSGNEEGAQRQMSKSAFELLHARYGNTEWARKTKYYY